MPLHHGYRKTMTIKSTRSSPKKFPVPWLGVARLGALWEVLSSQYGRPCKGWWVALPPQMHPKSFHNFTMFLIRPLQWLLVCYYWVKKHSDTIFLKVTQLSIGDKKHNCNSTFWKGEKITLISLCVELSSSLEFRLKLALTVFHVLTQNTFQGKNLALLFRSTW